MKENKKEKSYSVVVIDWVNGALTKLQKLFPSFKEAKDYAEDQEGEVKIYDDEKKVIYSENKKEKKDKKEKKEKKEKKDKDDDYN
jgi:hypothetical protein